MDKIYRAEKGKTFPCLLTGAHYCEDKYFAKEKERIFSRSWIFAASAANIAQENDYVLLNLFDWSVIVGRFGGKIRAFENRCPHRSSPLQRCESGRRTLKCPYHGWIFDQDGVPTAIPHNADLFGFDDAAKEGLRLKAFETDQVGEFIFVRMPNARQSLPEFLGTMRESLLTVDSEWTTRGSWAPSLFKSNWKIVAEIALEAYHAGETHPLSLGVNGMPPIGLHHFTVNAQGHQIMNIGNSPSVQQMTKAATVIFIFPNFFLIRFDEKFCSALSILPLSPGRSQLRSFTFFRRGLPMPASTFRSLANGLRATNLEDQKICEGAQERIHAHRAGQPLGSAEQALYFFHQFWLKKMSGFTWLRWLR